MSDSDQTETMESWEFTRSIAVPALQDRSTGEQAAALLRDLPGVLEVAADEDKQRLRVRYDPREIFYEGLTRHLLENGIQPDTGRWQRVKAKWYDFTDQNARENANAPPAACCNKSPK